MPWTDAAVATRGCQRLDGTIFHTDRGEEKFSTQREAILVCDEYASKLGFKPIPVPANK
jgi:hypothetical protein